MSDRNEEPNFLLDNFLRRVPHVRHTIALSGDGLLIARDTSLQRDAADRLAAMCAGLQSLLHHAGAELGAGQLSHNLAEFDSGFLLTMSGADGACLLLLADRDCDLGQVSFEMADLINRVGDALTAGARA
jgi:predicted regulator of Ras-like GTPase activity (Roadblock/LC7/MglB family)